MYQYTGNPFTSAFGPYTTSDFVTAMVRLADPLGANMPLTAVTPTAFTLHDGVQTISNHDANFVIFRFATDATAKITEWIVVVETRQSFGINTFHLTTNFQLTGDRGGRYAGEFGFNNDSPGVWSVHASVPDAESTVSLMMLALMALGVAARRFKRAAG